MKLSSSTSRLFPAVFAAALCCGASFAGASLVISEATGLFTPSFRGQADTTYFAWENRTLGVGGNLPNGTPSINPGGLTGPLFVQSNTTVDLFASSNNVYSYVDNVNAAQLSLNIPTDGEVGGTGFTTIIIQGFGAGGFGAPLDTFTFGAINGILPTYLYGANAASGNPGQWWAKWEIPGNESAYSVAISGLYVSDFDTISVTNMSVDTYYSAAGFAADSASAVPEPSALLSLAASTLLIIRRRR